MQAIADRILVPALKGHAGPLAQTYAAAWSYLVSYLAAFPVLLFGMDAPHGRFANENSWLNVNGNLGWFVMEIVSPIAFITSLTATRPFVTLTTPTQLLAVAFMTHYFNRAIIFVARQKGERSPMMIIVPLLAASFNLANGHMLGTWLSGATSSPSRAGAVPWSALDDPLFLAGLLLWLTGFLGNIAHDEILRRLRGPGKPAYSIPNGLLYDSPFGGISYPNYLCEWLEWTGWAIAATMASGERCPPALFGMGLTTPTWQERFLCPPWIFVVVELATMSPRALRGHEWYKQKFGAKFPKQRRAIVPGIL